MVCSVKGGRIRLTEGYQREGLLRLTRQSPPKKTGVDGWQWDCCPVCGTLMVPNGSSCEFLAFTDVLGGALDHVKPRFDLVMPAGLREKRRSCVDKYRE